MGISDATFYIWRKKYGGVGPSELRRLRQLEEENRKHMDNVKRVYRLYRLEGLSLRLKRPRRNKAAKLRQPKMLAHALNEIWSMDFVADALFDGRKLRMLTVVDLYTRECLAIEVGQSLKGEDVVRTLDMIVRQRGLPGTIKTDNGSEFISKVMDKWAYERASSWISAAQAGPLIAPAWKASMDACARSA
jgi:transposase InsO family protein